MVLCVPYTTASISHLSDSYFIGHGLDSDLLVVNGNKVFVTVATVGWNGSKWANMGTGHMGSAGVTVSGDSNGNTQHYTRQILHN